MKIFGRKISDSSEEILCWAGLISVSWFSFLFLLFGASIVGSIMNHLNEWMRALFVCIILFSTFCVFFTLCVSWTRLSQNLKRLEKERTDRVTKALDEADKL